jgi:hypothetical protein
MDDVMDLEVFLRPMTVVDQGISWPHEDEISQGYHWRCNGFVYFYDDGSTSSQIYFDPWEMYRETPQGAWFVPIGYRLADEARHLKKFVLRGSRKKFVWPTPELAFESFKIRLQHRRLYWKREGERIDALERLINDQIAADRRQ